MARYVPTGTPDPEADARFEAAPFPLLGVEGWQRERHLGGYGVAEPGDLTISLELVHGPAWPEDPGPRIAVAVSTTLIADLDVPFWRSIKARDVGAEMEEDAPLDRFGVTIDGAPAGLRGLRGPLGWYAQGRTWPGLFVTVDARGVAADDVRLVTVRDLGAYRPHGRGGGGSLPVGG